MKHIAIIFITALLSMLLNGYFYGVSDQLIYIPVIQKIADPSLYQNDMLFEQQSGKYTFFFHILAYLSRIFDMEWMFFIGYLAATFILFYAIYRISISLFDSEFAAYIAILLCFIPKLIGGSSAGNTRFLIPRSFAMPIALIVLWLFIERKYIWAVVTSAIVFQIHPLTAIAPIMSLIGYIVFNHKKIGTATVIKSIAAFGVAISPIFLKVLLSRQTNLDDLSFFSICPQDWIDILRLRNSYAFPSLWKSEYWKYAIFYPILFAIGFGFARIKPRSEPIWIVGGSLFSLLICYVFGDLFPVPLIVQCQMARGIFMATFLALIYAAHLIHRFSHGSPLISKIVMILCGVAFASANANLLIAGVIAFMLIVLSKRFTYLRFIGVVPFIVVLFYNTGKSPSNALLIISSLVLIALFEIARRFSGGFDIRRYAPILVLIAAIFTMKNPVVKDILFRGNLNGRIHLPGNAPQTSWTRLQKWACENTDKDSLFIVPRHAQGFRLYSMRSIAGDWKDGAPGLFSRAYALKWYNRMKSLEGYDKLKEDDFLRLARDYQATHVITKGQKLNFERIHKDGDFYIYEVKRRN